MFVFVWNHLGSSTIRAEIVSFNNRLRNQKTLKGYNHYQQHYIDYCVTQGFDHSKPSVEYLCKYLMKKFEEGKWTSASTFNQARSAISDMYRYNYNICIGESDIVCATINNISKHCDQPTQKKPLTIDIITRICSVVDVLKRDHVRNYYMMLLMTGGFLREAEVVVLEMARVHIIRDNNNVRGLEIEHIPFKKKTKEYVKKYISGAPSNLVLDVVTWHLLYMKYVINSGNISSLYLFHNVNDRSKLADNTAWHAFNSLFQLAGINYAEYGSQSARRGGATASFEAGVSVELIKQHGNWASNAVERYLKPSSTTLLTTTSFLNNNIQTANTTTPTPNKEMHTYINSKR